MTTTEKKERKKERKIPSFSRQPASPLARALLRAIIRLLESCNFFNFPFSSHSHNMRNHSRADVCMCAQPDNQATKNQAGSRQKRNFPGFFSLSFHREWLRMHGEKGRKKLLPYNLLIIRAEISASFANHLFLEREKRRFFSRRWKKRKRKKREKKERGKRERKKREKEEEAWYGSHGMNTYKESA